MIFFTSSFASNSWSGSAPTGKTAALEKNDQCTVGTPRYSPETPMVSPESSVQRCLPSFLSASSTATLPSLRAFTTGLFFAATSMSKSAQGDISFTLPSSLCCPLARIHLPLSFT